MAVIHRALVPHQAGGAFGEFKDCTKPHKSIQRQASGTPRWPLIHRNDLAVVHRLLRQRPKQTNYFDAGAGTSLRADIIAKAVAKKYQNPSHFYVVTVAELRRKYGH